MSANFEGNIRRLREMKALSQRDLAALAGISVTTVNRVETGLRHPIPSTVRKLAQALGVSPDKLLSDQLRLME